MNRINRTLMILGLISALLILLSPTKDTLTYFLISSLLLHSLIQPLNLYLEKDENKYFNEQAIKRISVILTALAIIFLLASSFQPVPFLSFFPFSYYFIISAFLVTSLYLSLSPQSKILDG